MTITPSNLSLLLAILSSIAPGTWALLAGILGALIGYFGKAIVKRFESQKKAVKRPRPKRRTVTRKN